MATKRVAGTQARAKATAQAALRRQRLQLHKEMRGLDPLSAIHTYRVDPINFIIWVGGDPGIDTMLFVDEQLPIEPGVEYHMADRFDINLRLLSDLDPKRPILIYMSTCGGYWEEGMQMFGALLNVPNPTTVIATKWARSMSSIVPLAADKFYLRLPGQYMFHYGSWGLSGLNQEAATYDIERRKSNVQMLRVYAARLREQGIHSTKTEQALQRMLNRHMEQRIDVWLDACEATRWGFVDGVVKGVGEPSRATEVNEARRQSMFEALSRPIDVRITVSL